VDVCLSLAHSVEQTNASVKVLREAQAAADYKLSALIDTVEKLVGNGHKGE
jgi:predicted restriction endonuclease